MAHIPHSCELEPPMVVDDLKLMAGLAVPASVGAAAPVEVPAPVAGMDYYKSPVVAVAPVVEGVPVDPSSLSQ